MSKKRLEQWLNKQWYGISVNPLWYMLAWPLSGVFKFLSRKDAVKKRQLASQWQRPNIPIIVVGNVTVGGSGKTPVVIALVEHLKAQGLNPGVISRGYGAKQEQFPHLVTAQDSAATSGDEPKLIVENTQVPLVIDPNRQRGVEYLMEQTDAKIDVIISDDGLQHYQLPRDVEILVVDAKRGFGNKKLLPLGPLREPIAKIYNVDFVVFNGEPSEAVLTSIAPCENTSVQMTLEPADLKPIANNNLTVNTESINPNDANAPKTGCKIHAVSGIGNPERFFDTLRSLGFDVIEHRFADHHAYQASDFHFLQSQSYPIVMTEKDAVKCRDVKFKSAELDQFWYLPVKAVFPDHFWQQLDDMLKPFVK